MKSIFLSHEQVFEKQLPVFKAVGTAAPAADLALLTTPDDGFLHEADGGINYYLSDGCVDRFGRDGECAACALRPALLLEEGDKKLLSRIKNEDGVVTAEYGSFPAYLLDPALRDLAEREFRRGALHDTGRSVHVAGELVPVYALGGKRLIRLTLSQGGAGGYVQLRDGLLLFSLHPSNSIMNRGRLISLVIFQTRSRVRTGVRLLSRSFYLFMH